MNIQSNELKQSTSGASKQETTHENSSLEIRKTVYRLQDHIDENGRYNDALKPIALGYAAGKGVSENEARNEISRHFKNEIGQDIKAYLEKNREARGLSNENGKGR